jgi:hypothetical protein
VVHAIEGVVENGTIRLREGVALPEKTKVYVIIAENKGGNLAQVRTPRLADPRQAADFHKQVLEIHPDAGV